MFFSKVLSALTLLALSAPSVMADGCIDIGTMIADLDDFSTLCMAIEEADLVNALSEGHWTVFAPTNTAFEKLGDVFDYIRSTYPKLLEDVLLFHGVAGVVKSDDLYCTEVIEMANGRDSRTVCHDDAIFQKGESNPRNNMPRIIETDIPTCQGYLHIVDEVMLPGRILTGPPKCSTIAEIVCTSPDFSTLCTAVQEADLADALDNGVWTVFAPTNEAFEELGDLLDTVLADSELLTDVLLFHSIANYAVYERDLRCTELLHMANGKDSRTVCVSHTNFYGIYQKGAGNSRNDMPQIVDADIHACNGVVHVVDGVMLPPL